MFDFFGLKKTRAKLVELEFVLEKQKSDIKTLEKVIDRLREALENEVSKNLQTESKSPKKKAVLETQPAQIVAAPAYEPVRSSATSTSNSGDMMTGIILGSLLSDNHKHSHSAPFVSSDTYSSSSSYDSSSSSSDSGSSSSSSD
jgi:pyridoxal/pyridoxine/pyridoxamine kinase